MDAEIVARLTEALETVNPVIGIYRTARERFNTTTNPRRLLLNPQMRLVFEHKLVYAVRSNKNTIDAPDFLRGSNTGIAVIRADGSIRRKTSSMMNISTDMQWSNMAETSGGGRILESSVR
ncbi:hypothetical protein IMZ48_42615 [Candidatus Bathyarchaeota archaeon]|nr:hypothetical protein [Candidatus Bathyarchaeota archaeon]